MSLKIFLAMSLRSTAIEIACLRSDPSSFCPKCLRFSGTAMVRVPPPGMLYALIDLSVRKLPREDAGIMDVKSRLPLLRSANADSGDV